MASTAGRLAAPFAVTDGKRFRLAQYSTDATTGVPSKARAAHLLETGTARLSELQEHLYAQDRWGLLLIFQAMDAAGKDGTIKHVMSGVNPQGCQVYSFKAPSSEELDHDFMWRTSKALPERGRIGIFNRSYYEEVLVVRVHPTILDHQRLPPEVRSPHIWRERFEDIVAFERYLTRNGIAVRKFFLHVSPEEQRRRLISRLDDPAKSWKVSEQDARERAHWDDYMKAYEAMIRATATPAAPWYVVPADRKWYTHLVVSAAIVEALESMNLNVPGVDTAKREEIGRVRAILTATRNG